jgi:hypothetical protein
MAAIAAAETITVADPGNIAYYERRSPENDRRFFHELTLLRPCSFES